MTFVDRFTGSNGTDLHGRTPSGAGASYDVTAGSFAIQSNAAQSGAVNSNVLIDPGITDLILSVVVRGAVYIKFRWDENADTGWYFTTRSDQGRIFYWDGSAETLHGNFNYNFTGNGDQWFFEINLTDPSSITIRPFNLQFASGDFYENYAVTVSSSLNNDKTTVGILTPSSGSQFDNLRCQTGSYDYPHQGLHEARIQRGILEDHVPYIISSYNTGTPARGEVWSDPGEYSPYYDGPSALIQLYDLWGPVDGALFLEAGWKQFEILHDDYYITIADPDYAIPGYRCFPRGPYQIWVRLSTQDAYDTVRYLPQRAAFNPSDDCSKDAAGGGYHRECAYALSDHVFAYKIGGVAASEVDVDRWDELREWCYEWVDFWCDEITPGVYAWTGTVKQVSAFMLGLMARSLWDDYTVSADARFPAALLKLCNFVWDNFWLPNHSPPALEYDINPDSDDYGTVGIQNDLNNLITAAFAKCAQLTGSQVHMDRADTLFSYSVMYGDFSTGGKQKNQQTTWLKDYIDWRAEFSSVRRSGRLLRRS